MSWIDIVSGSELDHYGVKVGRPRYDGESDVDYRVRLKSIPANQNRDDGRAAFPVQGTEMHETWYGMTLRDYFAAKAMNGYLANAWQAKELDDTGDSSGEQMRIVAEISYAMADAMLSERAK